MPVYNPGESPSQSSLMGLTFLIMDWLGILPLFYV